MIWENTVINKDCVKNKFAELISVNVHLPYVIMICFTNSQGIQRRNYLEENNIKDKEYVLLRKERKKSRNS